jgi:hypothetical protein
VIAGANDALALAIADLFWITIVAGALGLVCTLILRDRPLRSAGEAVDPGAAPLPVADEVESPVLQS